MRFATRPQLPFNNEQRRGVLFLSNPLNDIPVRSDDDNPHPRVDMIPPEQINTFRRPGNHHISRQVVPSAMIIGPPGTGKTYVICSGSILGVFNPRNIGRRYPSRIFIGTFSNAGSYRIYEKFHDISTLAGTPNYNLRIKLVQSDTARESFAFNSLCNKLNLNPDDFTIHNRLDDRALLNEILIFVGTTDSLSILSNASSVSVHGIIYDEASQLTVPQFFQVIHSTGSTRYICVVGDDAQLPPVATLVPLGVSTLSYLQGLNTYQNTPIPISRRIELERQYRMHPTIAQLTQNLVRNRRLVIPDGPTIEPDYLLDSQNYDITNLSHYTSLDTSTITFLESILKPEHPLIIVDTSNIPNALDQRIGRSRMNRTEAQISVGIFNALKQAYNSLTNEDIILTAPYRQQVNIFQENRNIRTGTVHQYQGQEALAVIYSLTYARPNTKSEFFSQVELMYVGLSRAQRKLIILGNRAAINHPDPAIQLVRDTIFNFQYYEDIPNGYPIYNINPVSKQTISQQNLDDLNAYFQ